MRKVSLSGLLRGAAAAFPLLLLLGQGCRTPVGEATPETTPGAAARPQAVAQAELAPDPRAKPEPARPLPQASWLPDGQRAARLVGGVVVVSNPATGAESTLRMARGQVSRYAAALRASVVALGGGDRVELFDLTSGEPRGTVERAWSSKAQFMALSPDGRLLAVYDGSNVHTWETGTGKRLARIALDQESFGTLRVTDDQRIVHSNEGQLSVWHARDGRALQSSEIPGVPDLCDGVAPALSQDGRWLAVTDDMKTVHILRTSPLQEVAAVEVSDDDDASLIASQMEFTSDDRYLLVSEHEKRWQKAISVGPFRLATPPCLDASLSEHPATPSPDGRWLLDEAADQARIVQRGARRK